MPANRDPAAGCGGAPDYLTGGIVVRSASTQPRLAQEKSGKPPAADGAARRVPRFSVIDGGLIAADKRQSSRDRLGEVELLWTVDRVCHTPGCIDFISQPPPGAGWRILDNGRDRRTLWIRRLPHDGGAA